MAVSPTRSGTASPCVSWRIALPLGEAWCARAARSTCMTPSTRSRSGGRSASLLSASETRRDDPASRHLHQVQGLVQLFLIEHPALQHDLADAPPRLERFLRNLRAQVVSD